MIVTRRFESRTASAFSLSDLAARGGFNPSAFAINASTGQITVADVTKLNHEVTASYALTVKATDSVDPKRSGSGTITLQVIMIQVAHQ